MARLPAQAMAWSSAARQRSVPSDDLRGERAVALVGEARAAVFERRREIGVPRVHAPERVEGRDARERRHRRQAAPAGRAGAGASGGGSNRTPAPARWPAAKSRAVMARRPSGWTVSTSSSAVAGLDAERVLREVQHRARRAGRCLARPAPPASG